MIQLATESDIQYLIEFRQLLFKSMGFSEDIIQGMLPYFTNYFEEHLKDGTYKSWLVTRDGKFVATGGMVVDQHPPSPSNKSGKIAYIMSMYTMPEYRNKGIAKQILESMIEYARDQGITTLSLHTTDMARPLYAELGFKPSNEMVKKLKIGA